MLGLIYADNQSSIHLRPYKPRVSFAQIIAE